MWQGVNGMQSLQRYLLSEDDSVSLQHSQARMDHCKTLQCLVNNIVRLIDELLPGHDHEREE